MAFVPVTYSGQGFGQETLLIALTATALTSDRENYLGAGVNHYITKPILTIPFDPHPNIVCGSCLGGQVTTVSRFLESDYPVLECL